MGEPKLRCVVGANHGTVYPVPSSRFTLGRSSQCELVFAEPSVSSRHAEMAFDGRTLTICDLASRNGLKVNGERIASADLKHGDQISLGELVLRVEWPSRDMPAQEPDEWQKPASADGKWKKRIAYLFVGVLLATLTVLLALAVSDKAKMDRADSKPVMVLSSTIHAAAASGKLDAIREHIKAGRDINSQNEYGYTPLHSAVSTGQIEAVKLLLELGADPTIKSNDGVTPADLARMDNQQEISRILNAWKPKPKLK